LISVDKTTLQDFQKALTLEWLETDGLGGYASSTVLGINTRRYHGLLVAPLTPPVNRVLLLAKLEETATIGTTPYLLSANCYPDTLYPHGHRHLEMFRLDPWPVYTYRIGSARLEKHCFMVHGQSTLVVAYHMREASVPADLHLRLTVGFRSHHDLGTGETPPVTAVQDEDGLLVIQPRSAMPDLYVAHTGERTDPASFWYRQLKYPNEADRGFPSEEDLYSPGAIIGRLKPGGWVTLIASTRQPEPVDLPRLMAAERERRSNLVEPSAPRPIKTLTLAASQFTVRRGSEGASIIAGYPWFTDWGRDTMISMPGLTLATGRAALARSILDTFAGFIENGLLPNYFPHDGGPPSYDNVDAALWFILAAHRYMEATDDEDFLKSRLAEACGSILRAYESGTTSAIRMEGDGLLSAGESGSRLTWMDSKVGDMAATPRHGRPVEINALWYNSLRIGGSFASRLRRSGEAKHWSALADKVRLRFEEEFWYGNGGYCYDLIRDHEKVTTLRPNQIFALSLPYPLLDEARRASVLAVVTAHLLTPVGLRTLSPYDPRYSGRHGRTVWEQDSSYHQGTVWAYLIGPYIDAYLTVHGDARESRAHARRLLAPLVAHLREACLGTVSELFDGDPPHSPQGCIAQAWSVAEVFRVLMRLEEPLPKS
jgi:predicted glycogen debranching enzyme